MPTNLPNNGLIISNPLAVSSDDFKTGLLSSQLLTGGYQEVATIQDRNDIPVSVNNLGPQISEDGLACGRRRVGMVVFVIDEGAAYRLVPSGYFESGSGNITQWQALSSDDKAKLLDPTINETYGPQSNPTQLVGGGNADDCWQRIWPLDDLVNGTLPELGDPGNIIVKKSDDNFDVGFTVLPMGSIGTSKVVSAYYGATAYELQSNNGQPTKAIAGPVALPGVRSNDFYTDYSTTPNNSDVFAWEISYKVVLKFEGADSETANIDVWVGDEENPTLCHPSTWTSLETLDRTTGGVRNITLSASGMVLSNQPGANSLSVSDNIKLFIACGNSSSPSTGNLDNIFLRHVYFSVKPIFAEEVSEIATASIDGLKARAIDKQLTGNMIWISGDGTTLPTAEQNSGNPI